MNTMKERPILMSGTMVRAILEGRKTQTRRIVKLPVIDKDVGCELSGGELAASMRDAVRHCPYGQPGNRLWVKETFKPRPCGIDDMVITYEADGTTWYLGAASGDVPDSGLTLFYRMLDRASKRANAMKKPEARPSIYMPRWASRITLEVTAVRVERLQEISEDDAKAEGVEGYIPWATRWEWRNQETAVQAYQRLWQSINGPGSWDANPWVWVISFKRITL